MKTYIELAKEDIVKAYACEPSEIEPQFYIQIAIAEALVHIAETLEFILQLEKAKSGLSRPTDCHEELPS